MGRNTQLSTCKASPDDPRINGDAWIPGISDVENNRQRRRINLVTVRRRLTFDDNSDSTSKAGPSKQSSNESSLSPNDDKSSIKWNFDFENETPLPGDWQWVKVNSNSPVLEESTEQYSEKTLQNESHPKE